MKAMVFLDVTEDEVKYLRLLILGGMKARLDSVLAGHEDKHESALRVGGHCLQQIERHLQSLKQGES